MRSVVVKWMRMKILLVVITTDGNMVNDAIDEQNNGKDMDGEIVAGNIIVINDGSEDKYVSNDETMKSNSEAVPESKRFYQSLSKEKNR